MAGAVPSAVGSSVPDSALRRMLEPRTVAVVGASARPGSFGERMVAEILASAAELDVHLVNPGYDTILGRPCVPSLDEIAGPVDLVMLGVGDASLEAELTRAAKRGDGGALVFGNAYEEPAEGADPLRLRLAAIARDAGMAMCGAGCMGFVNVARGVRAIGYLEPDPLPAGGVALVTHSGSMFSALLRARRGFGYCLAVSSGQELVTPAAAYLDYALGLSETTVVALVLEAIRDPLRLRAALRTAADRDLPVVLLPVGVSEAGRSMVAAHSGAIAGGSGAWEALSDAYGVHLVSDASELLDTVEVFAAGRRARPRSGYDAAGIAAVLDSGAERALLVDVAAELGVPFAAVGARTTAALEARLDPGLVAANPLDVWGNGADTEALFADSLVALGRDPAVRALALAVDLVEEYDGDDSYRDAVLSASAVLDLPVVVVSNVPSALDRPAAARLRAAGVPVLEGTRSGLLALRHLLAHADRDVVTADPGAVDDARRERWIRRLRNGPLDGAEAFALLADYGITVVPVMAAADEPAVIASARKLGYPVVLKTDTAIDHKTDVGGVVTGLADEHALVAAYRDLAGRLGPQVIVCAQAASGVEVLVGAVRDPALGMLVVVGVGGVLVEHLGERAVTLPPVSAAGALRLVGQTALEGLLARPRRGAPADLAALGSLVTAFSVLVAELGEELEAIDLNPVICTPDGAIAVDVHVAKRRDAVSP
ncbi:MAG TPA: acetate--CoA ligase family protein [Mycobacteriales bacterium]|nr:acetate--CoA ligase family protein [Mycobacteriales bacterium]